MRWRTGVNAVSEALVHEGEKRSLQNARSAFRLLSGSPSSWPDGRRVVRNLAAKMGSESGK